MEATGVYWIPLYQLLSDAGIKVCLVNARHVKNVPGRKSDVRDCQWLQYLHSVGLLRASYRPDQAVCSARSIYRFRQRLLIQGAQHLQHMQAALDQMNIKLHHVINDLSGQTELRLFKPFSMVSESHCGWLSTGIDASKPLSWSLISRTIRFFPHAIPSRRKPFWMRRQP
jgi:hypothetical protein